MLSNKRSAVFYPVLEKSRKQDQAPIWEAHQAGSSPGKESQGSLQPLLTYGGGRGYTVGRLQCPHDSGRHDPNWTDSQIGVNLWSPKRKHIVTLGFAAHWQKRPLRKKPSHTWMMRAASPTRSAVSCGFSIFFVAETDKGSCFQCAPHCSRIMGQRMGKNLRMYNQKIRW